MIRCFRMMTLSLTAFLLAVWSAPCHAAESALKEILTDSLYGCLSGVLVGGAVMAFTKKPGMHLDYMGYGAAGGVLVGAAVGFGRAAVEINDGKVKFSMPAFIPDRLEPNSKGQSAFLLSARLIRGTF
jgi:hypothetical protein